jgi:hypothetical protein
MSRSFRYTVSGTARHDQTWTVNGTSLMPSSGVISDMVDDIMHAVFTARTQGKAIYGKPGVGCEGPYRITKLVLEEDQK